MIVVARRLVEGSLPRAALADAVDPGGVITLPGRFRRAAGVLGDLVGAGVLALCFPLVILSIGIPIALSIRLLLWVGGLL